MADNLDYVCTTGETTTSPLTAEEQARRDLAVSEQEAQAQVEAERRGRRQLGIDAYRDLVSIAKDAAHPAILRRICRDVALAVRALSDELQDDESI